MAPVYLWLDHTITKHVYTLLCTLITMTALFSV